MTSYNCQITKIGDCLRTKRYGRKIYEGGKNPRKSNAERSVEIQAIADDQSVSKLEKLIHSAILEPPNKDERSGKRPDRTPKPGRLTLSERERFCHLMDRNFSEGHKFLTLTYEKEDVSLDESARDFENWVKRMRERYDDFKYLAVRSYQQRGTLHYHLLTDLPTIPRAEIDDGTFRDIWGHGSALIKRIYNLPMVEWRNRLKLDLLKNLRCFKEDKRSYGKRLFLQSKNLIVPPTIKGDFDELMERLKANGYVPKLMDSYSFETEFLGTIQLGTYWLTKQE